MRLVVAADKLHNARAIVSDIRAGGRVQGGSTLTQQLARTLFLSNQKTYGRKAREAVLALMIDSQLSKEQAEVVDDAPGERRRATFDELDGSVLTGTPDDIVRGVQRYQEIGCDLLIFDFRMRFPDWLQQIETLSRDVLPRVSDPAAVGLFRCCRRGGAPWL